MTTIKINYKNGIISVASGYDAKLVELFRSLDNRRWNPDTKEWHVGLTDLHEIFLPEAKKMGHQIIFSQEYLDTFGNFFEKKEKEQEIKDHLNTNVKNELKLRYPKAFEFQLDAAIRILTEFEMANKRGFGLFWEMGAGKTFGSLIVAKELINSRKIETVWIIVPASLKQQWKEEILKWNIVPEKYISIISGSKKKREIFYLTKNVFNIISYETFRNDKELIDTEDALIILDEITKAKNEKSQIYNVLSKKLRKSRFVIGLTGTPLENRLKEFFNIVNLIQHDFMSWNYFASNFCLWEQVRTPYGYINQIVGYQNLDKFVEKIQTISDRKTKEEVAKELPKLVIEYRQIPITNQQKYVKNLLVNNAENFIEISQLLRVLDNGINDFLKSDKGNSFLHFNSNKQIKNEISKKLNELEDLLYEINGRQVLIFTEFAKTAHTIYDFLKEKKMNVNIVTGETSEKEKNKVIKDFKEKQLHILVATDTLAYGVSFGNVDYEINYDLLYNPQKLNQRYARIHRINSTRPKTVINFVGEVIERDIYELLKNKQALFEMAVEGKTKIKYENIMKSIAEKYGLKLYPKKVKK